MSSGGAGPAGGGSEKPGRNAAQDAKLTAAEFELMRTHGPTRCTHAVGAELIVNAPAYSPLPSGAKVVVEARDHGPPATYTVRFLGQADVMQDALSGAEAGTKDQVVSGVLEKYLRSDNILTTARNCAGNQGIENILKSSLQYTVPLFQRKYCWQLSQWRTLWRDIRQLAASPSHHMGKLAIYEEPSSLVLDTAREQLEEALQDAEYQQFSAFSSARNGMSRAVQASQLMVIDGQQRLTTTCVILAAIRDVAEMIAEQQGGAEVRTQAAELAAATNALLYREDQWFAQYQERATSHSQVAADDVDQLLEWFCSRASFLPTHDDRSSYAAAVLPQAVVPTTLRHLHWRSSVDTTTPGTRAVPFTFDDSLNAKFGNIFCWAAGLPAGTKVDTAVEDRTCINRSGFTKLLKLMGHIRPQDDMLEAPWVQLCAKVDTEPSRGLEFDTFRRVLSEELQGSGGPIELAQAVEELYTRAICHVSGDERGEGEDSGENPTEPSYILECKNYYVEQILRYVSSPTMDEENAKAAIARLSELSVRVRTRLKFVFFELPSDASVQLFFEQLAMKESYQRSSKMMTEGAPGISISLVDLCRNKILSYFADERVKIRAYEQYWLEIERKSGALHGNLAPLETFLGYFLNTVCGMEGPEIAGELYKVFKAWLAQRIPKGSSAATPAPGAAAAAAGREGGGGGGGGAEGDSGTMAVAVPSTAETIAVVATEALAEMAAAAESAPYPMPPLPAKHQLPQAGGFGPNWAPEQSQSRHQGPRSMLAGGSGAKTLEAGTMPPPPPRAPNRNHRQQSQDGQQSAEQQGHAVFDPTAGIGGYGSTIAPGMLAAATQRQPPPYHRSGGTGGATGVSAGASAAMQRDWAGTLDMMAPGTSKSTSVVDSEDPDGAS